MADVRVIVQARLNSSRLPGKCLLPIGGVPLVVLCAMRAANTGLPVVVATSTEESDDPLAKTIVQHGLNLFRGSLTDVYTRFLGATEDLADDAFVVRLTADNVFPDGAFVEDLIGAAIAGKVEYVGTHSPLDGLPYGLSAEIVRVRALRSVGEELDDFDREHVTPAVKRRFGSCVFRPPLPRFYGHLRATIDTLADYQRIFALFYGRAKPEKIHWMELCALLCDVQGPTELRIPYLLKGGSTLGKLTLGTAQLGLAQYGRTNRIGRPSAGDACQLIRAAIQHGVSHLDCAGAYGVSEERVGEALDSAGVKATVITKLSPLENLPESAMESEVRAHVGASVFRSAYALRRRKIDVLMLHRWSHFHSHSGRIWKRLIELQVAGVIGEMGASVYNPEEAKDALAHPEIKHLQIPFNILDTRWQRAEFSSARDSRPEVTVYGRSAFLQGVLLAPPELWPAREQFAPHSTIETLNSLVTELGRRDRADLSLAFALGSPEIDSIVMGMESMDQLRTNLALFQQPPLTSSERKRVHDAICSISIPEWLLNPSEWRDS